jgi:hypothetical protein
MTWRTLAALALGLAAVAAAPAGAAVVHKDVAYWVEFQGEGDYHYAEHRDFGTLWDETEMLLDFRFGGVIDEVVFRDGHLFDTTGIDIPSGQATGTLGFVEGGDRPRRTGTCDTDGDDPVVGRAELRGQYLDGEPVPLDGEDHVFLRPFDHLEVGFANCPELAAGTNSTVLGGPRFDRYPDDNGVLRGGDHLFDMPFSLPREAVGMGYIEQLIPEQTFEGVECPNGFVPEVTTCSMRFHGKLVFRKGWEKEVRSGGEVVPPSTNPADEVQLVPLAPLVPPAAPSRPRSPATSSRAALKGSTASFRQSCAAACTGTASVFPAGAGARAAAKRKPLARTRFKLRAGATRAVRLKLSRKALRAARRARGLRIVVATRSGGVTVTRTLKVAVRRR